MAIKNYYAILGVSRDETPAGIRAAYREAVRRTHPDYAGPEGATAFHEVVEAHSVLSDPNRRRRYNERLDLHNRNRTEAVRFRRSVVHTGPRPTFTDINNVQPPFEALAEQLLRNFIGGGISQTRKSDGLSIEVILTPEEAARGGFFSIEIPAQEVCRICGGTGNDWLFSCLNCGGQGAVSRVRPVRIPVPQSLRLGAAREVYLQTRIDNLHLHLRIRVANEYGGK